MNYIFLPGWKTKVDYRLSQFAHCQEKVKGQRAPIGRPDITGSKLGVVSVGQLCLSFLGMCLGSFSFPIFGLELLHVILSFFW